MDILNFRGISKIQNVYVYIPRSRAEPPPFIYKILSLRETLVGKHSYSLLLNDNTEVPVINKGNKLTVGTMNLGTLSNHTLCFSWKGHATDKPTAGRYRNWPVTEFALIDQLWTRKTFQSTMMLSHVCWSTITTHTKIGKSLNKRAKYIEVHYGWAFKYFILQSLLVIRQTLE